MLTDEVQSSPAVVTNGHPEEALVIEEAQNEEQQQSHSPAESQREPGDNEEEDSTPAPEASLLERKEEAEAAEKEKVEALAVSTPPSPLPLFDLPPMPPGLPLSQPNSTTVPSVSAVPSPAHKNGGGGDIIEGAPTGSAAKSPVPDASALDVVQRFLELLRLVKGVV
jgi:hypothetical protein